MEAILLIKPSKIKFRKELMDEFEKTIGVLIPNEYLNFLVKYNGGKPEANIVELKNDKMQSFAVNSFFGVGVGVDEDDDILKQYLLFKNRIPHGCIPIAYTEGGNIVCINIGSEEKGHVFLWDHEEELSYEGNITIKNLYHVADSFLEFLDKIKPYNSKSVDLSGYEVKKVWIDPEFLKKTKG